jgi:hypothetical protein
MNKKLIPFQAIHYFEGVDVSPNWRYRLVLPYITQSPSFIAVKNKHNGLDFNPRDLPNDEALVYELMEKFDLQQPEYDVDYESNWKWWFRSGKHLYGTKEELPDVKHQLIDANESATIKIENRGYPTMALQIPLTMTAKQAWDGIKAVFNLHSSMYDINFDVPLPDVYNAEFKLLPSKLRHDTLLNGAKALPMYKAGIPLWKIGNTLKLSPNNLIDECDGNLDQDIAAEKKRVLSIMARRLINTASLVAENAARGRFPSDKPFAEAKLGTFTRTAGRPLGSKRPKRIGASKKI